MANKLTLNSGIALVTGSASGLGKETAFAFAEAGVRVVVFADINEEEVKRTAEASKVFATNPEYEAFPIGVDISIEESVETMVDTTVKQFGRIDYSVNSAGLRNYSREPTLSVNSEAFSRIMDVNLKGTMFCNRAVARAMSKQEPLIYNSRRYGKRDLGRGSIVNVGSVNSYVPAPGFLPYTTSKHAIVGITKSAALDNLANHIRVNTVCPAWIETPMHAREVQDDPIVAQVVELASPLRRTATPEEVADYIVFLCSPSASYISGTGLTIDAGLTLTIHIGAN